MRSTLARRGLTGKTPAIYAMIEAGLVVFGDAAVDDMARVSGRQPS